jgi:hypothetical protein
MTRKRQFTERKLLKVYLDDTDFQRITASAKEAGISISEWVRGRCDQKVPTLEPSKSRPDRNNARKRPPGIEPPNDGPDTRPRGQSGPTPTEICPHHKQRGELCYKCDPKFGRPQVT